jgi:hypothetical protein
VMGPGARNPMDWEEFKVYRRPGPITLAWRWRTEIALTVALVGLEYLLTKLMGFISGVLVIAAAAAVLCALPPTRNWIWRRGWCVFTRHRLYSVFRETWTTTRMGRLPLIMRVSPIDQGVRVVVWCRAGISVEGLHRIRREIRDACLANEVHFQPPRAPFAQIEIIRSGPKSQDKPRTPSPRPPSNENLDDV